MKDLFTLLVLLTFAHTNISGQACPTPDHTFCYVNNLSSSQVLEVCPAAGVTLSLAVIQGSFEVGFDELSVYSGVSGSGTSGTQILAPTDGDFAGDVFTGVAPGECLIFIADSDGSVSCDSGAEDEFQLVESTSPVIPGCTDNSANNFDASATCDDGSCVFPPANDDCANATPYTDDFTVFAQGACTGTPSSVDLSTATSDIGNDDPSCDDIAPNVGVWYTWTATHTVLNFDSGDGAPGLAVYEAGTCGSLTEVGCLNNLDGNIAGLTVGNDYIFYIWDDSDPGVTVSWCLEAFDPPANDDCAGAITLPLDEGTSCGASTITGISNAAATDSGEGTPSCGSYSGGDLFYEVVIPAGVVEVTFDVGNVTGLTSVAATLNSGTCGALVEEDCTQFSSGWPWTVSNLTPGDTYYLRVYDFSNDQVGTFDLCGFYSTCTPATFTLSEGSNNCPSDEFFIDVDVTNLGTATTVDILNDGGAAAVNGVGTGVQSVGPFASGTAVNITVQDAADPTCSDMDALTITSVCAPANDDCAGATALTVGAAGICNNITATNVGATASGETPVPSCSSFGTGEDIWFSVVVPTSGSVTIEASSAGGPTDWGMSVYSGSCGSLTEIECDDDDGPNAFPRVDLSGQSGTLLVRLFEFGNNATGDVAICAFEPPANDDCAGALSYDTEFGGISANGDCASATSSLDLTPYTADGDFPSCNGFGNFNAWYTITTGPAVYDLIFTSGTGLPGFAIYEDGTCGSLTELGCLDNTSGTVDVCPNTTYIIQIWDDTEGNTIDWCLEEGTASRPCDCEPTETVACDDGFSCTENDMVTRLVSDNSVICEPCAGTPVATPDLTPACGDQISYPCLNNTTYPSNDLQTWTLTPGPSEYVKITFTYVDVETFTPDCFDFLQIVGGGVGGFDTGEICSEENGDGGTGTGLSVGDCYYHPVPGESVTVTFDSDGSVEETGFAFTFDCVSTLSEATNCAGALVRLPIELLSFEAEAMSRGNRIRWSTASEINNDRQIVQSSVDGISDWKEVHVVESEGNTESTRTYEAMDYEPSAVTYYRLYSVDLDGSVQISDVVEVKRDVRSKFVAMYPNPTNGETILRMDVTDDQEAQVMVTDVTGKVVYQERHSLLTGSNRVTLDIAGLAAGVYFVQVNAPSIKHTEKLFVNR